MRKLTIAWAEFELATDARTAAAQGYVDRETGATYVVQNETFELLQDLLADAAPGAPVESVIAEAEVPDGEKQALREAWLVEEELAGRLIDLADTDLEEDYRDLADFTATVKDLKVRQQLDQAISGPEAFRRFRDIVHGTFRERQQWFAFEEQRRREKAAAWLATHGIEVEWRMPQPLAGLPPRPPPREHLLAGVLKFTRAAAELSGVTRIALLGSLTRDEPEPKDADVLVTVSDTMDLTPLAKLGRQLAGHTQQLSRGADVFLANERGAYIGRTCHWRDCAPGIRQGCDALHCGRRHYLHDDLKDVRLAASLIAAPPIELWPRLHTRAAPPADVERMLLAPLRAANTPS